MDKLVKIIPNPDRVKESAAQGHQYQVRKPNDVEKFLPPGGVTVSEKIAKTVWGRLLRCGDVVKAPASSPKPVKRKED